MVRKVALPVAVVPEALVLLPVVRKGKAARPECHPEVHRVGLPVQVLVVPVDHSRVVPA